MEVKEAIDRFLSLPYDERQIIFLRCSNNSLDEIQEITSLTPEYILRLSNKALESLGTDEREFKEGFCKPIITNFDASDFGLF